MGIMDMLNPMKAAGKVGGMMGKAPGMKKLGNMAQGASSAFQKFAPPGMKPPMSGGIGPSMPQMNPMSQPNSMSQMAQGFGGMFGGQMKQPVPNGMGQMETPQMEPMQPQDQSGMGPSNDAIQQLIARMRGRNTGISGKMSGM